MFIETKEGQTHATCEERLKKYGGKAECCLCNKHDGCGIADSEQMFSPHEMTKATRHAGKYMKKEQDKVLTEPRLKKVLKSILSIAQVSILIQNLSKSSLVDCMAMIKEVEKEIEKL